MPSPKPTNYRDVRKFSRAQYVCLKAAAMKFDYTFVFARFKTLIDVD